MKKGLVFAAILLAAALFFIFDLHHWLTLDSLKSSLAQFEVWRSESPLTTASVFFVTYVFVTALSLPGAAIMTLAGGALFGLGVGLLLVSFASSIGALFAFLVSRYLLQDTVQKRFGSRLSTINQGIERDGAFYLFTLRLVPIFPFFLINLLMGLTPIKASRFYWVSQVGMLAGTVVYVNAGTQIANIDSLSGILSPALLLSFVLLGIFPLIGKKIVSVIQKRRVYAKWTKPTSFDRNLIVIGAGAGGLVSSYIAAAVKAKVTLIEANKMGGDCLNYGCVPSKALIKSAKIAHAIGHAEKYGLESSQPRFSFRVIMERIHQVIRAIEPHDSIERYTDLGVEVKQGYAKMIDPWTVEITDSTGNKERLTARSIVIATGARPFIPPLPGLENTGYVTSDTLWDEFAKRDYAPKQLIVLGGGPIGCELSQSFARLGSQVVQVERGERILPREDDEVATLVARSMGNDGVQILTQHTAVRCEMRDDVKVLIVEHGGIEVPLVYDELLIAVGRQPHLTGYGLEELGINTDRTVTTNEYLETLYPNVYAVGDVAGPYQFTHTAAHQAWYATVNALFGQFKRFRADYRVIPWTTFTDPEVARVGLSEAEAAAQGIAVEVTRYQLNDLDRAITESETEGFVKVLTEPGKDKILGVCIAGSHAGDLLPEFVLAMKHGLGLNKILGTIHTYPTWAEANKYAAGEWKRAHAPQTILRWLEKYHTWRRS